MKLQHNNVSSSKPNGSRPTIAFSNSDVIDRSAIAVIGMAGRFPGANNIDEFWQNIRDGVESITIFSDEELLAAGVAPDLIHHPNYVKASPTLSNLDGFDAFFFDYSAKEALFMDPQQRIFLECAWEALENAGYQAGHNKYTIGIYGGSSISLYLLNDIIYNNRIYAGHLSSSKESIIYGGNVPEALTTRVAYKLNLTGPAVHISTACSTSLVAVHSACQSLLNAECEIALAGGVSYLGSQKEGYIHEEGLFLSPDGHCRSFDAKGKGTLWGNGVGIVVLKMLEDALADGDYIHAVIKGSAVNNDGKVKVSHSAPSVDAQARVIYQAQEVADVHPETITYIEAHGTATPLGDPVEIAALTQAFRAKTQQTGYCAIGSLKSNIGHLSEASGVAALIKSILVLKNKQIPPSLHFETPNHEIDFEGSPFYVNTRLRKWDSNGSPRRAGVSSFGMGGTNAHVVLEEWNVTPVTDRQTSRDQHLLLISAKTATALEAATGNLVTHLQNHSELKLTDVAYTLARGRKAFSHRRVALVSSLEDAASNLLYPSNKRFLTNSGKPNARSVVFMFSGQGSQYVNMARDLYSTENVFQEYVDQCCRLLSPHLGFDLRDVLYPTVEQAKTALKKMGQTSITQPALFVVEYALAQQWMAWGIKPSALIGHSIGEYVAATLAGVFSLADALALVVIRGQMMQSMPSGTMLAVPLPESQVQPLLEGTSLEIGTINSPANCVVSGTPEDIDVFERKLSTLNVEGRRLHTSHAFHSRMMEPILKPFIEKVRQIKLAVPSIPFVSNLTGTWITSEQATNPNYYAQHMRSCIRFAEGVKQFFSNPTQILLEVGPGRTLSNLAKQHPDKAIGQITLTSVRPPQEEGSDVTFLLNSLGQLWLAGLEIDWDSYYVNEEPCRVPLPTYPFERKRYWLEPKHTSQEFVHAAKKADVADWFYQPSWKRMSLPAMTNNFFSAPILVFSNDSSLSSLLVVRLKDCSPFVIVATAGNGFDQLEENLYTINPADAKDYERLIQHLETHQLTPKLILHLWNITSNNNLALTIDTVEMSQGLGFYSLLYLTQAFAQQNINHKIDILVISNHLQNVTGEEKIDPAKATIMGAVRVIPREFSNIHCCSIDIPLGNQNDVKTASWILKELQQPSDDKAIAYRGNVRWVEAVEPTRLESPSMTSLIFRTKGVYLITGGTGGMGLVFAEHLAKTVQAQLVLISRSPLPARKDWKQWLTTHADRDPTSAKISKINHFEALGAQVLVLHADVTDQNQMAQVIDQTKTEFGQINGVIHTAGLPGGGVILLKTQAIADRVFASKVKGTVILDTLFKDVALDFMVLCSSLEASLGHMGQIDYCAANNFLDAYAQSKVSHPHRLTLSINWDAWKEVGMAVETAQYGLNNKVLEIRKIKHHLFEECIIEKNQEIYISKLDSLRHWIVGEHIVLNTPSLVGTAYLEIARAAYEYHSGKSMVQLQDVYFLKFLFVEANEQKLVRTILKPNEEVIEFSIQSLDSTSGEWDVNAQGRIVPYCSSEVVEYSICELEASCHQEMIIPDLQTLPDYTHYGSRWLNNIKWRKANEDKHLALMELPEEFVHDLDQYKFHPSLVDTATYVVADVLPNELGSKFSFFHDSSAYLPYFYGKVTIKGALPARFYSYTTRKLQGHDWSINLSFLDTEGIELIAIENYLLKFIDSAYTLKDDQVSNGTRKAQARSFDVSSETAISPKEGVDSLERLLQSGMSQVIVSTIDFSSQISLLTKKRIENAEDSAELFERPHLAQAYKAPSSETERAIAQIWQQVLGTKDIGIHDNFFDLGGDSLLIVQILQKLRQTLKQDLTINALLNANTVAEIARVIDPTLDKDSKLPACLVKFRGGGNRVPIFLVHPVAGNTRNYVNLPNVLNKDQPIYGIQHPRWVDETRSFKTIEDIAAYYIQAVRQVQTNGPYCLGGYSGGVYIVYEMAQQLTAAGEKVDFLAIIDKPHWVTRIDKPNWQTPQFGMPLETIVYYADMRTPKPNGESHWSDYQKLGSLTEQLRHFINHSPWIQGMMPSDATDHEWRVFWDIFVELRVMNVNYALKPYHGQTVYFAAEERDIYKPTFNERPWFELVPNLIFEEVPGDHVTIWHQPNVRVLGQKIQQYLNALQQDAASDRSAQSSRQHQVDLSQAELLEEAKQETGLSDFGDRRFLWGLEHLLDATKQQANLHPMGQTFVQALIVRLLGNRLTIQDDLKCHPEILQVPIQKPLYIIGLPRTGSTYLHNLLCQDPATRWLHLWEVYEPSPSPNPDMKETDPRIKKAKEAFNNYELFTLDLTAIHKYDACAPEECAWLLQHDFNCLSFSFLTSIPSYTQWLKTQDMIPVYEYYRQQLQLLGWKWSANRWVLTNLFHLGDLSAVATVFPNAHFVQTHRDPVQVVASYSGLVENLRPVYSNSVDRQSVAEEILDILCYQVKEGMKARENIESRNICDIQFNDLVENPIDTIRQIYEYFGYEYSQAMDRNLCQYIQDNPRYKHGTYSYSLEEFGLDSNRVNKQFEGYSQHFKVLPNHRG